MTPAQESAMRRWCTRAGLSPITPQMWAWLMRPDENLREFLRKSPEELAAFCADEVEAPDATAVDLAPWRPPSARSRLERWLRRDSGMATV